MKELQVLYLGHMRNPTLPSTIEILENLRSLYLDGCNVKDVAILGKLKTLQILSFVGSAISRLPKEIGELTNLRSLNLTYCYKLEIIEPGVLKGLINLEELLMRDSFAGWMGEDEVPWESCKAKLVELRSLTKLSAMEISIRDPTVLLGAGDLPFGSLIRFWIAIGNYISVPSREFKGLRTMKLNLEGCDSILSKVGVQKTLHETQHLQLEGLRVSKENIAHALLSAHELFTQGFPQLKHLDIWNSPSIEYIASSSDGTPLTAFPKLESFLLGGLTNLEKIWNGPVAPDCFSKLKEVYIGGCDRLKYWWCLSQMQRFVHLEEIVVWGCESMRAIVIDDARANIVGDDVVELPNLRRLTLAKLPRMTSFCIRAGITLEGAPIQDSFSPLECPVMGGGNKESVTTTSDSQYDHSNSLFDGKVNLPRLEELRIYFMLSIKRIWHGELPGSSFCKLATLDLYDCSELVNVFPSTIIGRLHNLKEVKVSDCPSLESLFDCGTLDPSTEQTRILLPKLEMVSVEMCPSLESLFDCGSHDSSTEQTIVQLPKLKEVRVDRAEKLRHMVKSDSQVVLSFPDLTKVNCEKMTEVVPEEEVSRSKGVVMSFPSLTDITIQGCPNFGAFKVSTRS